MYIYCFKSEKDNFFYGVFQADSDGRAAANLHAVREHFDHDTSLYKIGFLASSSGSIEPLPEPVKIEIKEDSDNE